MLPVRNEFAACNDAMGILFYHDWLSWGISTKRWSVWGRLIGLAIMLCGTLTFILRLFINWYNVQWIMTLLNWPCRTCTFIIQGVKSARSRILFQIQYSTTFLYRESWCQIVMGWETFINLILFVFSHSVLRSFFIFLFLNSRNDNFCSSRIHTLI